MKKWKVGDICHDVKLEGSTLGVGGEILEIKGNDVMLYLENRIVFYTAVKNLVMLEDLTC